MGANIVARRRLQLIYQSKRLAGLFDLIHQGLIRDVDRAEILDRMVAARYCVHKLMAQLLEEEVMERTDMKGKSQDEIADSMMQLLKSYIE